MCRGDGPYCRRARRLAAPHASKVDLMAVPGSDYKVRRSESVMSCVDPTCISLLSIQLLGIVALAPEILTVSLAIYPCIDSFETSIRVGNKS